MKKLTLLISISLFIFSVAGNVAALPVVFEDVVFQGSFFQEQGSGAAINHNILDNGFNPNEHQLTSATLDICFWGIEENESSYSLILDNDYGTANAITDINRTDLFWTFNILYGDFSGDVNVDYLQADGTLNISLTQTSDNWSALAISSTLRAYAETDDPPVPPGPPVPVPDPPAPTPEPSSVMLLGLGLVSFAAVRKKFNI